MRVRIWQNTSTAWLMANEEHLRILLSGVEKWNEWRKGSTTTDVDLSGADLSGAVLDGADLTRTNLSAANLSGASLDAAILSKSHLQASNLQKASLVKAHLYKTILRGCNLQQSRLSRSDLTLTNVTNADLRDSEIVGAFLNETTLAGADLTGAVIGWLQLSSVSLAGARGLHEVRHYGPSHVSVDTLDRTAVDLAMGTTQRRQEIETFLERVGVPKEYVEFFRSRIGQPIQFYSCFISYSTLDQEFADRLYADLRQKNIPVWLATEDLKIGDKFRTRINDAIRVHDKLLVVLSEHSMKSAWVEDEFEAAFERESRDGGTVLFPIRLDDAVTDSGAAWAASIRRTRHIGDFTKWKDHDEYQKALARLIRDLQAEDRQKSVPR